MLWGIYSERIIDDPYNVVNYEKLILAAELQDNEKLICQSYELLLSRFPLLVNYHLRYLQWMAKNKSVAKVKQQYEFLLTGDLKYSCDVWISYLKFTIDFIDEHGLTDLIALFERARKVIGFDYWKSEQFYLLYLQSIITYKPKNYLLIYYTLVRIAVEVPMYNYRVLHQIWLQFLGTLKYNQMKYLKMLNKQLQPQKTSKENLMKVSKLKWKKSLTDLYITTQYKSYELFKWEKQLANDNSIDIWKSYLQFVIVNYPSNYCESLFERALLEHSAESSLWWMYASWLLNQQKPMAARQTLYRSIKHLVQQESTIARLVDMELYARNYLKARDLLLGYMESTSNSGNNVILFEKLIMVELVVHANDEGYILGLFKDFLNELGAEEVEDTIGYICYRLSLIQSIDVELRHELIMKYSSNSSSFYKLAICYITQQLKQSQPATEPQKPNFNLLIETYL